MTFRVDTGLLLLTLFGSLSAQNPSPGVLHTIEGTQVPGVVESISTDGVVTVRQEDGSRLTVDLAELRSIGFVTPSGQSPLPRQGLVLLRSGVALPATVRESTDRRIAFDSPLTRGRVQVPLSFVQAIRYAKFVREDDGGFSKYLNEPKEQADLIYFRTSTNVVRQRSVQIQGFDGDDLNYEVGGSLRGRPVEDLYGIVMANTSGFEPDPLPRPRVQIVLQGGSTMDGKLVSMDQDVCVLELPERIKLEVRRERVVGIEVWSDRLVYLSELEPSKVEQTPAFGIGDDSVRQWMVNRTPLGMGIHIGGTEPREVVNGLVLRPRTLLTYDVGGRFDTFKATVCIDRRSSGPAHAVFRVLAGEEVLFSSSMTLLSEPESIELAIGGVESLTIEVDFGQNFDFGDHCAFAEARLIKRGP